MLESLALQIPQEAYKNNTSILFFRRLIKNDRTAIFINNVLEPEGV